jgi:hypothetical protein
LADDFGTLDVLPPGTILREQAQAIAKDKAGSKDW